MQLFLLCLWKMSVSRSWVLHFAQWALVAPTETHKYLQSLRRVKQLQLHSLRSHFSVPSISDGHHTILCSLMPCTRLLFSFRKEMRDFFGAALENCICIKTSRILVRYLCISILNWNSFRAVEGADKSTRPKYNGKSNSPFSAKTFLLWYVTELLNRGRFYIWNLKVTATWISNIFVGSTYTSLGSLNFEK